MKKEIKFDPLSLLNFKENSCAPFLMQEKGEKLRM